MPSTRSCHVKKAKSTIAQKFAPELTHSITHLPTRHPPLEYVRTQMPNIPKTPLRAIDSFGPNPLPFSFVASASRGIVNRRLFSPVSIGLPLSHPEHLEKQAAGVGRCCLHRCQRGGDGL